MFALPQLGADPLSAGEGARRREAASAIAYET